MMYILRMAFRNVWRNRRRSILAFTSVAIAIAGVTFFRGFAGGMLTSIVKNSTKNETGHIRITTTAFKEKATFLPVTENIQNPHDIINRIHADEVCAKDVRLITERINFGVLLAHQGNNKYAAALAGDPDTEKELLLLQNSIREGRYLQGNRETIIGASIAHALKLTLGDTLKVMTTGADYALHLRTFKVVGIFETGLKLLDDKIFQIPLKDAQQLLRTEDASQQIIIMLHDYKQSKRVASHISTLLNDNSLAVMSWTEHGEWGRMVQMASAIYNYVYFFIALLGAFIITNILMMVVLERRKEIGILKALGISRLEVMALFLFEGIILGCIGSVVGLGLGMLCNIYFATFGLDMSSMMGSLNFPIDNRIYFDLSIESIGTVLGVGISVSAIVSLLPSWRAARMHAVDAIKSV